MESNVAGLRGPVLSTRAVNIFIDHGHKNMSRRDVSLSGPDAQKSLCFLDDPHVLAKAL